MAKDLFSTQADLYAKYRPAYPKELFEYIVSFVPEKNLAWDCATGNGQAALALSEYFNKVIASDISEAQLKQAVKKDNIEYTRSYAESTHFDDNIFDLVTVAQAYHWFKWDEFKKEVERVCKPGAVIAIWTYDRYIKNGKRIDDLINEFYNNVTGPYWDPERRHVEERYENVDFDFENLPTKNFDTVLHWNRNDMLGFISTWSATHRFIQAKGYSPISQLETELKKIWPENEIKEIVFPIYLKLGRVTTK